MLTKMRQYRVETDGTWRPEQTHAGSCTLLYFILYQGSANFEFVHLIPASGYPSLCQHSLKPQLQFGEFIVH